MQYTDMHMNLLCWIRVIMLGKENHLQIATLTTQLLGDPGPVIQFQPLKALWGKKQDNFMDTLW